MHVEWIWYIGIYIQLITLHTLLLLLFVSRASFKLQDRVKKKKYILRRYNLFKKKKKNWEKEKPLYSLYYLNAFSKHICVYRLFL